jgi:hypothetical protein
MNHRHVLILDDCEFMRAHLLFDGSGSGMM